jgi:hypothetical protein
MITWCDIRVHKVCTDDGRTVQELYSKFKNDRFHVYSHAGIELDPEKGLIAKI